MFVLRIHQHSSYDPFTTNNDISILELVKPFVFGPAIQPAVLAAAGREPADLEKLVIAGWGVTSEGGASTSDILKKATVPYVPNTRCSGYYNSQGVKITEYMLCAGYEYTGGVDACQGDSGGPIFFASDKTQIGITSFGVGCARPRLPGVYTRIPMFRGWIHHIAGV